MPIIIEVPKEGLVGRGEHRAKIVAIGEPQVSRYDANKQSIKLVFEITSGKHKGERLTKHYTFSLGSKAALGILWRRLLAEPKGGEKVDLERLLDRECSLMVTHRSSDVGETYAIIQDVFAPGGDSNGD